MVHYISKPYAGARGERMNERLGDRMLGPVDHVDRTNSSVSVQWPPPWLAEGGQTGPELASPGRPPLEPESIQTTESESPPRPAAELASADLAGLEAGPPPARPSAVEVPPDDPPAADPK